MIDAIDVAKFPAGLHPATARLVRDFAYALAVKLMKSQEKYGYTDGWFRDYSETDCRRDLRKHLEKGNPIDVAAYVAFMWRHGWTTVSDERFRDALEYIRDKIGPGHGEPRAAEYADQILEADESR